MFPPERKGRLRVFARSFAEYERPAMSTKPPDESWPDPDFIKNQNQFPLEELLRYVGQEVAWSWDGRRILASAPTAAELHRKLIDAGIDPQHVVSGYVEHPDVSYL